MGEAAVEAEEGGRRAAPGRRLIGGATADLPVFLVIGKSGGRFTNNSQVYQITREGQKEKERQMKIYKKNRYNYWVVVEVCRCCRAGTQVPC